VASVAAGKTLGKVNADATVVFVDEHVHRAGVGDGVHHLHLRLRTAGAGRRRQTNAAGRRRWKSVASWYAMATRSSSASPKRRPRKAERHRRAVVAEAVRQDHGGCPVRFVAMSCVSPVAESA
jgi:hypothetical protein